MVINAPICNALWFLLGDLGWLTRAQSIWLTQQRVEAMAMARDRDEPRTSCVRALAEHSSEQIPFPMCAVNAPRDAEQLQLGQSMANASWMMRKCDAMSLWPFASEDSAAIGSREPFVLEFGQQ